jgi:hypothetical protein
MKTMIKEKFWLILGTIAYFSIIIYSIPQSLIKASFITNLEIVLDWLAASIIYFFIGACIGIIIYYKKSKKIPIWFFLTISLWMIGTLYSIFIGNETKIFLSIIMPLAYGIFLTGAAYTVLVPSFINAFSYSKIVFDLIIIFIFYSWLYYNLKRINKKAQVILICLLFLILLIGIIKSSLIFF